MRMRLPAVSDAYRLAWRGTRHLPAPVGYGLAHTVADALWAWQRLRRSTAGVGQLERNLSRILPAGTPAPALHRATRAGMRSYMRYFYEAFALPGITPEQILARVRTDIDPQLREDVRAGSVVMALPHMGNWDLIGAWACRELATVLTVAERLEPEDLFEQFVSFRQSLGMRIIGQSHGEKVFDRLLEAASQGHYVVALLADRDLSSAGITAQLGGATARVAAGPAAIAQRLGRPLYAASIHYEPLADRADRPQGSGAPADGRTRAGRGAHARLGGRARPLARRARRGLAHAPARLRRRPGPGAPGSQPRPRPAGRPRGGRMRIGIVCPYSFDAHGGVQVHVMDLAGELFRRGHEVQVLAPASQDTELPEWVTSAGDSIAIPYNGSVARLNFGALVARRARRWLDAGDFDILHIHEPITPSVGMLALQAATGPVVGTFHAAMDRSLARELLSPATVPLMEKLSARIAVSEEARRTLIQYHGGDAVVIPNGVNVGPFADAPKDDPRFLGTDEAPTISFLGRLDEPRKGLRVLADAIPTVLESVPRSRFLIAGRGQAQEIREELTRFGDSVVFLGGVSDEDKAAMLASASCYVAPQTGGESFGIVLVEAMAAGTRVIASDLKAFSDVLGEGRYGALFRNEDGGDLARVIIDTLQDAAAAQARVQAASQVVGRYDWSAVTDEVLDVYDMALSTAHTRVEPAPGSRTMLGRLRDALDD